MNCDVNSGMQNRSATASYFAFLSWHQSSSRLVTVFLGTLWCSIKKMGAPYVFNWEYDIALHEMQVNQASCPGEWYVSWDFRVSTGTLGIFSSYSGDGHAKLHLRCWWKVGSNLQSKTGNQLSSWDDMGCIELSSSCCTDINIHIDLRLVSQGISVDSSRKSSHLYCMLWNTG